MYQLLKLIHAYRAFLIFLLFEFVCLWLLVRSNPYHSAAYFHTSNAVIGSIYQTRKNITQYIVVCYQNKMFGLNTLNQK